MPGPRGPKISDALRQEISASALARPYQPREELAQDLKDEIEDRGDWAPTIETLIKMISAARRKNNEDLDKPWSVISLLDHHIPPDALESVLQVWAWVVGRQNLINSLDKMTREEREQTIKESNLSVINGKVQYIEFLTIREALWVARLYQIIDLTEERWSFAHKMAVREKVRDMEEDYPSSRETILPYWVADAELCGFLEKREHMGDVLTQINNEFRASYRKLQAIKDLQKPTEEVKK
jgi:hypothetical protein